MLIDATNMLKGTCSKVNRQYLINQKHEIKCNRGFLKFYEKQIDFSTKDCLIVLSSQLSPSSLKIITAICSICGDRKEVEYRAFNRHTKGFCCSPKCTIAKTQQTLLLKYGVKNASLIPAVQDKKIKASLEKYGTINVSQSKIVKDKVKQTVFNKYGSDNVSKMESVKDKKANTTLSNYGVRHLWQSDEIRISQVRKKYGEQFVNVSQIGEVMDKKLITGLCARDFELPSGGIVRVQGYEHFGIAFLIKKGIQENDIFIGNKIIEKEIGKIFFFDKQKNKTRRYFPDIFVKSENKIYEVKSTYTITLDVDSIKMKEARVKELGLEHEFLVFDEKGELHPLKNF